MKRETLVVIGGIILGGGLAVAQLTERSTPVADTEPAMANEVKITVQGDNRGISSNGLPDHAHGAFPNRDNPNSIRAQNYRFTVPVRPQPAARPVIYKPSLFGIAVNGVVFDPGSAEFWNRDPNSGWTYEVLAPSARLGQDGSNAHVQPNGAYHYHGIPTGLVARLSKSSPMPLIGYAADGYPIYARTGHAKAGDAASPLVKLRSSYRLKPGTRPSGPGGAYDGTFTEDYEFKAGAGDLDECNGRTGVTPDYPEGTYYYVLTDEFPFVPRLLHGVADRSFRRQPPPGGMGGGMPGGPPGGGFPGGGFPMGPPPPGFPPPGGPPPGFPPPR